MGLNTAPLRLWHVPSMRWDSSVSWAQLLTLLKLISTHFWLWWEDSFINSIHVCCLQSKQYCLLMGAPSHALSPFYANAFLLLVLRGTVWGRRSLPGLQRQAAASGGLTAISSASTPQLRETMSYSFPQELSGLKSKSGLPWRRSGKNPPANAGDAGSSPGPGRSHIPRATKPVRHNYWACASGACAPQQERPPQWEAATKSSPRSLQLEKAHAEQQRPNAAKNKINNFLKIENNFKKEKKSQSVG